MVEGAGGWGGESVNFLLDGIYIVAMSEDRVGGIFAWAAFRLGSGI